MNTYIINKSKLSKKPIGKLIENSNDFHDTRFRNIVIGYMNNNQVLIKTNLSQELWDSFCNGRLSKQELEKYI